MGEFPKATYKRYEVSCHELEKTATIDVSAGRMVVARSSLIAFPELKRPILNSRQTIINLFKDAYFIQNGRDIDDEYIEWDDLEFGYMRRVPPPKRSSRK